MNKPMYNLIIYMIHMPCTTSWHHKFRNGESKAKDQRWISVQFL